MLDRNAQLFAAFKRLDALCGQIYGKNGVTQYIHDMENAGFRARYLVDSWNHDLDMLKRVRHIRNLLAHEPYLPDTWQSTERDVLWIEEFHQRILDRTDPLARLRAEQQMARLRAEQQHDENNCEKEERRSRCRFPFWIIPVVFGIVLLGCFLIWLFIR